MKRRSPKRRLELRQVGCVSGHSVDVRDMKWWVYEGDVEEE
jgi:hypothetical protein